ncbi:MAG: DUF423 domain-containing protein [Candidatus Sericytochromatia bacterium]|nr:DUF423 domain-containing protein [Candidatus Sericytochromatia bacterium]
MPAADRLALTLGAASAGLAVALGAFGAHGLKARVAAGLLAPERLETWHTAAQYQMWHALALLALAVALRQGLLPGRSWPVLGLLAGTVLFSGSLYALVLTGVGALGAITPLGGATWLVTWAALAVAAWRHRAEG